MLRGEDISLFGHGDMRVDLCNIDRTMSQYLLDISNINIGLQQACSEGVAEHMRSDMHVNRREGCIPVDHSADSLI